MDQSTIERMFTPKAMHVISEFAWMKFSKGKITITSKDEEGVSTTEEIQPGERFMILASLKQYDATIGKKSEFETIGESNEFVDGDDFIFVNYKNNTASTGLSTANDVKKFIDEPLANVKRKTVVYLYNKNRGIVKLYLRMTQTIPMKDGRYDFANPIENGFDDITVNFGKTIITKSFKIDIKGNGEVMETFYPLFLEPEDHKMKQEDVFNLIGECFEAANKFKEYLNNKYMSVIKNETTVVSKPETVAEVVDDLPF